MIIRSSLGRQLEVSHKRLGIIGSYSQFIQTFTFNFPHDYKSQFSYTFF
jgi:hypothetical protein